MRTPSPSVRAAWRCASERGPALAVFTLATVVRRGRGDACRSGLVVLLLRVNVMAPTPPGRGRAALPGPTPDAWSQSLPPRGRSGGPRPEPAHRAAPRRRKRSCELRHRQEVPVEDPEPQRAEEAAEDPEADDDRRLGPTAQLEVVVDGSHTEDAPVEGAKADDLQNHRHGFHDEEAADDEEEEIEVE